MLVIVKIFHFEQELIGMFSNYRIGEGGESGHCWCVIVTEGNQEMCEWAIKKLFIIN